MFIEDDPLNTPELLRLFLQKMMSTIRMLPDYMKKELIVTKINLESLLAAKSTLALNTLIQSGELYNSPSRSADATNMLALAICTANVEACNLFLLYFKDLNDSSHFVRGYRQDYSWLHLALDPHNHIGMDDFRQDLLNLEARCKIIDLLGENGADPNWVGDEMYRNPPMAAGEPSGRHYDRQTTLELRKHLLACGANPSLKGSSFSLHQHEINELTASPVTSPSSLMF